MQTTEESVNLTTEEGSIGSLKREELGTKRYRKRLIGESPEEEDELELMFKLMD
jgi:hypothetical protein